jgi:peptide/nickel transport system permease protein
VLESADTTATTEAALLAEVGETPPEETYRKKRMTIGGWLAVGWLVFITAACILAPVLPLDPPTGPNAPDYENFGVGPMTAGHVLGTDDNGRDVLSRVIWGGRASMKDAEGHVFNSKLICGILCMVSG